MSAATEIATLAEIGQRLALGDVDGALAGLEENGRTAQRAAQHEGAAVALLGGARLALLASRVTEAARLVAMAEGSAYVVGRLGELGRAQAELAQARGDAEAERTAWRGAVEQGDTRLQEAALTRLAELAIAGGQAFGAVILYERASTAAAERGDMAGAASSLIDLAACWMTAGDPRAAEASLVRAEAFIPVGDPWLRARLLGQRARVALDRGEEDSALALALAAREAAVSAGEGLSYLASSALVAALHARAGRDVDAWDTLVRARAGLGDRLGEAGAALVEPLLESFAAELGDRCATVRGAWAAARRAETAPAPPADESARSDSAEESGGAGRHGR